MELLYVWIKDYNDGVIEEQGYNFSGQYRFRYDPQRASLWVEENPHYQANFFTPRRIQDDVPLAQILNVTAIVGQNGAGKSTVLEFLKRRLPYNNKLNSSSPHLETQAILILQETVTKKGVIYYQKDTPITNGNYEQYGFHLQPCPIPVVENLEYPKIVEIKISEFQNTSLVFFSNVFDTKQSEIQTSGLINISTNYLLRRDKFQNNEEPLKSESVTHRVQEVLRQVNFITKSEDRLRKKINFSIPDHLSVIWGRELSNVELGVGPLLLASHNLYSELGESNHQIEDDMDWLAYRIFSHVLNELHDMPGDVVNTLNDLASRFPDKGTIQARILRWLQLVGDHFAPKGVDPSDFHPFLVSAVQLLRFVQSKLKSDEIKIFANRLIIPISPGSKIATTFLELYRSSFIKDDYLLFDWRDMSSGEKALFGMYARFFSVVEQTKELHLRDHLLILIDEGELYLHPQWQKNFLRDFIDFTTHLFRREQGPQRTLQIILTSNSPFLISDLPNSNVVFIRRENGFSYVVEELDELHQTFASNIHSLFAHSFFMQDSLIGSFAKDKINEVIHLLVNGKPEDISLHRERIEKTIHIIGEPVIKNKLLQMLQERAAVNSLSIREEIELLQSRIAKLEGNLDDPNSKK